MTIDQLGMLIIFSPWWLPALYIGLGHFVWYATGWAGLLPRELRR